MAVKPGIYAAAISCFDKNLSLDITRNVNDTLSEFQMPLGGNSSKESPLKTSLYQLMVFKVE